MKLTDAEIRLLIRSYDQRISEIERDAVMVPPRQQLKMLYHTTPLYARMAVLRRALKGKG